MEEEELIFGGGLIREIEKSRQRNIDEMKDRGYQFTDDGYYLLNIHNTLLALREMGY